MKKVNCIFVFLTITSVMGFSQNRYAEPLPPQAICPSGMAYYFRNRQNDMPLHPFDRSVNCRQSMPVAGYTPEGTYWFSNWHPFKRKKKKSKVVYPKKSSIIRF